MSHMITIKFPHALNVSVQPKDTVYATGLDESDYGYTSGSNNSFGTKKPQIMGVIDSVDHVGNAIVVDTGGFIAIGGGDLFYFFSKNRIANTSGLLGYYAEVEYRNDSKKSAEIFAVGTGYAPSSK